MRLNQVFGTKGSVYLLGCLLAWLLAWLFANALSLMQFEEKNTAPMSTKLVVRHEREFVFARIFACMIACMFDCICLRHHWSSLQTKLSHDVNNIKSLAWKGMCICLHVCLYFLLAYAYNVINDAVYRQSLNQNVSKREYWERNERLPKLKVLDCT